MHVTSYNTADWIFFQAKLAGGDHEGEHALFFVDKDTAGVRPPASLATRTPIPTRTRSSRSRTRVPAGNLVGEEGDGMSFTHEWFRYERLTIAARCCGAMERLIEEATAFAAERVQFGRPIVEFQAIGHMLADSTAELWASRLMTYELGRGIDAGIDVKTSTRNARS